MLIAQANRRIHVQDKNIYGPERRMLYITPSRHLRDHRMLDTACNTNPLNDGHRPASAAPLPRTIGTSATSATYTGTTGPSPGTSMATPPSVTSPP